MPEEFFRVRNVKKAFGNHLVLSGVNLDVHKGEILGIIGTSGSGKTTLLHVLIGFLKPDKGEVRILLEPPHRALGTPTYKDVHKHLSLVKQVFGFASQIPSFYDNLTVLENLKYFGSLYDLPKYTIQTNMKILLHLMDLEQARKLLGKNLSGGMERRLDIACALIHDPAVLILDEPTADLDPVLRNHIYDLIRKINNKETTIVLASHHLSDLERVCDRIAILKDGKIFTVGTLEEIKKNFSDYHQVSVKLGSKKYHDLAEEMKKHHKKLFIKCEAYNQGLMFSTNQPHECAKVVMQVAKHLKDKVEDLHIGQQSLDDIFITIVEEDQRRREQSSVEEEAAKKFPDEKEKDDEEREKEHQRKEAGSHHEKKKWKRRKHSKKEGEGRRHEKKEHKEDKRIEEMVEEGDVL
ncbi:ABC transporter ATP-binding protein [Candidatus Woesearchaeota archaeon]|nr:ABC transporter ATP-binding protein [Candidatus Woesearchaeota archaeon]